MEIRIPSPSKAVCTAVFAQSGDLVSADTRMAELIPL